MYTLKDNGIIEEISMGNNFCYVWEKDNHFLGTDYKVLQSQSNGIFIHCSRFGYNGKVALYYVVNEFQPLSLILPKLTRDSFINVVSNLLANVIEVRNNGFLTTQNIDISWNKIYVDANTLSVKLVYIPISCKVFDNCAIFENELRSGLIKLINLNLLSSDDKIEQLLFDLSNSVLSLDDLNGKLYRMKNRVSEACAKSKDETKHVRLIAMNSMDNFEIMVAKDEYLIGKNPTAVDGVITFSDAISRVHCKINKKENYYTITDLHSSNGTYINRNRLNPNQEYPIKNGDVLRLANSDFQISIN